MSERIRTADLLTIPLPEDLLPTSLCEIVEVIGLPATITLIEHRGGTVLWVPGEFDPQHPLVKQIGHDAAQRLIELYAGEKLEIAKAERALLAIRNAAIRASDKLQRELALQYGLTVRQIRNIQNCVEEDDGQEELF